MQSIIDFFLVWWLRTGRYGWSKLRRRLFERHYLKTALPTVNSLEDIEASLKQITWTKDGPLHLFDCISYPNVTWEKKKDDCDGFSSLAAELLKSWKPDCRPALVTAMVHPVRKSHTVCAFTGPQEALWFFDNSLLRSDNYQTYNDVVARISNNTESLICWDVRDPTTLGLVEFHKM